MRWMVAFAAVLLGACSGGGGGGGQAGGSTPPPTPPPPPPVVRFDTPGNPLSVVPQLDAARAVTAVIPASGGELSATAADGSTITLVVPDRALFRDTRITMTPVSAVGGLPLSGGLRAAVQLEPEGLRFFAHATLTFAPARVVPVDRQALFGWTASGQDFGLVTPSPGAADPVVKILHFSGYGVGDGSAAERAAIGQRQAAAAEARLEQAAADLAQRERLSQLAGNPPSDDFVAGLARLHDAYRDQVVKPRLAAAADCVSGKEAMRKLAGYLRNRELHGMGEDPELFGALTELIGRVFLWCIDEAYDKCVAHDVSVLAPTVFALERWRRLLGLVPDGAPFDDHALLLLRRCYRFELGVASMAGVDPLYDATASATIPIRHLTVGGPSAIHLDGGGEYQAGGLTMSFPGCSTRVDFQLGNVVSVSSLRFVTGPEPANGDPAPVTGVELDHDFGPDWASVSQTCTSGGSTSTSHLPVSSYWRPAFVATHLDELGPAGFTTRSWTFLGGAIFATREWNRSANGAKEATSFTLRHLPGEGGDAVDPDGLAVAVGVDTANVSWLPLSGATGYVLDRRDAMGAYAQVHAGAETSFQDSGLHPGAGYVYRLRAQTADGLSPGTLAAVQMLEGPPIASYAGTADFQGTQSYTGPTVTKTIRFGGSVTLQLDRTSGDAMGALYLVNPAATRIRFATWDTAEVGSDYTRDCSLLAPASGDTVGAGGLQLAKVPNLYLWDVGLGLATPTDQRCRTTDSQGNVTVTVEKVAPALAYGSYDPLAAGDQYRPWLDGQLLQGSNAYRQVVEGPTRESLDVTGTWSLAPLP